MVNCKKGKKHLSQVKLYQVIGRKAATEVETNPPAFRMKLFANNSEIAKSRFWYFMHQFRKMKRTTGEIIDCNELREKNARVIKNYGIWMRYDSRSGTHNMYREYRDLTLTGAVDQMCKFSLSFFIACRAIGGRVSSTADRGCGRAYWDCVTCERRTWGVGVSCFGLEHERIVRCRLWSGLREECGASGVRRLAGA